MSARLMRGWRVSEVGEEAETEKRMLAMRRWALSMLRR